jgi:alpha/beta superfamily hydrolase
LSNNKENDKEKEKEKGVMIICGPNAAPYEIFSYTDKWVDFYLENGISVLLWNYRSYGESTGKISFDFIKEDSLILIDYIKNNLKYSSIGVHGISLGGIPACYLAE